MKAVLALTLLLLSSGVQAQVRVTARVVDAGTREPLPYATIAVIGKANGTISNADGYFGLNGPGEGDTLCITFVGYRTRKLVLTTALDGTDIPMQRATYELREVVIRPGEEQYERVIQAARWLRKAPMVDAKLFFGMETYSDGIPVEMIHAYFNTSFHKAHMFDLQLKQGRIGLAAKEDRFFINYNTTRALAVMDILAEKSYFPTSPLKHTSTKYLKRGFSTELISEGSGADGVDHLRVTPRQNNTEAFTLDLWLDPDDDHVRALDLHCHNCPKHPFAPLFDHGRIDTVDLHYRQTWSASGSAFPEITELSYRMAYTGPGFSDTFGTHAIMHAFDPGTLFIPPIFDYAEDLPDYRKIGWLPEDSLFWARMAPPLPTDQQRRDRDFLERNDLRHGPWFDHLQNDRNYFAAHYLLWSPNRRVLLRDITTQEPVRQELKPGFGTTPELAPPPIRLVAQLYLDLDTVDGRLLHRSATVLDGFESIVQDEDLPWTACFHNIWFDLCEIERLDMEERLNTPGLTLKEARSVHAEHTQRLKMTTFHLLQETYYGMQCEPLFKWNEQVKQALGIDNIALLGM